MEEPREGSIPYADKCRQDSALVTGRRLIYTTIFTYTGKTGGLTAQASNAETVRSVATSGVGRREEKRNTDPKVPLRLSFLSKKYFFRRQIKLHETPFTCLDMEMSGRAELSPWSSQVT